VVSPIRRASPSSLGAGADNRALRDALAVLGDRFGLAVLIVDASAAIVFASARARRLVGSGSALAKEILPATCDGATSRIVLATSPHPIVGRAERLPGSVGHLLVTLEELMPRRTLSRGLADRYGLSARSIQLVQLTARGLTNREIGERMHLSEATVKTYMYVLFREVGVRNRAELVALADRIAASSAQVEHA